MKIGCLLQRLFCPKENYWDVSPGLRMFSEAINFHMGKKYFTPTSLTGLSHTGLHWRLPLLIPT